MTEWGVWAPEGPYISAIAELAGGARRSDQLEGAIAVVPGDRGWGERVRDAIDGGAAGVVLRDPRTESSDELAAARQARRKVPMIVERPRLRWDIGGDAKNLVGDAKLAFVQVQCSAAPDDIHAVVADAVGWAATLAGGPLLHRASRATVRGMGAVLDRDVSPDVCLPVAVLVCLGDRSIPWIRALAVGVDRTEVVVDAATWSASVERTARDGRFTPATRYETSERLALRRMLDALDVRDTPADLDNLARDSSLARQILAGLASE